MQPLLIDYLRLRRAVGALGVLLPFALLAIAGPRESLSAYYYSPARDVLVGVLCIVAALLAAYRGHDRGDRICSATAAVGLVVVALFPTGGATHAVHLAGAGLFFAAVVALCERFGRGGYRPRTFLSLGAVMAAALLAGAPGAPRMLCESVAVVAFGAEWMVKGRALEAMA
ncbi:MAG TPA: hypothetical protein PL196_00025 [Burkholderiaceae bacterium]|nr:hypothetical protein [Burkholderiaceae bacterium]